MTFPIFKDKIQNLKRVDFRDTQIYHVELYPLNPSIPGRNKKKQKKPISNE
jgi:hypothetical protein